MDDILRILREVVAASNKQFSDGTDRIKMICWDVFFNWKTYVVLLFVSVTFLVLLKYEVDRLNPLLLSIAKIHLIVAFLFFLCLRYEDNIFKNASAFVFFLITGLLTFSFFCAYYSFFAGIALSCFFLFLLASYLFLAGVLYIFCLVKDLFGGLTRSARKETWIDARVCQARKIYDMQLSFFKKIKGGRVSLEDLIAVRRAFALSNSQIRIRFVHGAVVLALGGGGASLFSISLELMGVVLLGERYVILTVFILIVFFMYVAAVKAQEEIDDYLACLDFVIDRLGKDVGER